MCLSNENSRDIIRQCLNHDLKYVVPALNFHKISVITYPHSHFKYQYWLHLAKFYENFILVLFWNFKSWCFNKICHFTFFASSDPFCNSMFVFNFCIIILLPTSCRVLCDDMCSCMGCNSNFSFLELFKST